MLAITIHHRRLIPARFGLVLVTCLFLDACASIPGKAEYDAQTADLIEARQQSADALAKQAELEKANQALNQSITLASLQITDLEARNKAQENRIKELEATNAKLDGLLNEVQVLQLTRMLNPAAPDSQNLQSSSVPVTSQAISGDSQADPVTKIANPAQTTPTAEVLIAAATSPAPRQPEPTASPAIAEASKPAGPITGLGHDVLTRVERHNQRGTELFAERDSASGIYYLYHRLAWYDQPGVFVEFSRPFGGIYQARLIVQMPVNDHTANNFNSAAPPGLLLNGRDLGQAVNSRILIDGNKPYLYAAFNLDDQLATNLRSMMLEGQLSLMLVQDPPQAEDSPYVVPPSMTAVLREMLEARNDLK